MPCRSSHHSGRWGPADGRAWWDANWRENPNDADRFPAMSLRTELLIELRAVYQAAEDGTFPATPPIEIMAFLNEVGPPLNDRFLPLIEVLLDGLWEEGLLGLLPAPSPRHPRGYLIREAAELAISRGAPVLLLPLSDGPRR